MQRSTAGNSDFFTITKSLFLSAFSQFATQAILNLFKISF